MKAINTVFMGLKKFSLLLFEESVPTFDSNLIGALISKIIGATKILFAKLKNMLNDMVF